MCETGVHWRVFDPRENILLQVKMLHGEKETVKISMEEGLFHGRDDTGLENMVSVRW